LEALYNNGYEILAVVTNPDKPKGRGMKMVASPVKEFALSKNIPIYQPERVKENTEFINKLKELKPDVICVVAYGKILPQEIL
jgi:methionyl-tRNA formyltransferase